MDDTTPKGMDQTDDEVEDEDWDDEWEDDEADEWDEEGDEGEEGEDDAEDWDAAAVDLLPPEVPAGFRSGYVAVIGRPNVGKSTLVNAYVGQKVAIVSPKPQTTRRRILGVRTEPMSQIVFVDTPGIHQPHTRLGEFMVEAAVTSIPDADVILFVVDVSDRPRDDDRHIGQLLAEQAKAPVVIALNKADLVKPQHLQQNFDAYLALAPEADYMLVSAQRGDNLDKLLDLVSQHLPEGPLYFPPDQVTDQSEQAMVAELVREAVLHLTEAEVPHSVAVAIEEWVERSERLTYIDAAVYVERQSQKAIVIGKRGAMIKQIGALARREIEALLERQVFLELRVKVREEWRRNPTQLRRFGFTEE